MEGYNRFLIVGLVLIGLVRADAGNHKDLSGQQSVAEDTPRTLKKRSNSNLYGGMPWDEYEFTMNEALGIFAREAIVSAAGRANYQRNYERALETQRARRRQQQAQQAQIAQQQASQSRAAQPESSQFGRMPGSPQYGRRPASPQYVPRPRTPQYVPRPRTPQYGPRLGPNGH